MNGPVSITNNLGRCLLRGRTAMVAACVLAILSLSLGGWGSPATVGAQTAKGEQSPEATCPPGGQCFADVPPSNTFYTFINRLYQQDIISGYTCGGVGEPCDLYNRPYYRPTSDVNRQQMTKFIDNARHLPGIFINTSTNGQPIYSLTTLNNGIGLHGEAPGGIGVRGIGEIGVRGTGNPGVQGESAVTGGIGVYGLHTATTGTAAGVYGSTASTAAGAIGVEGEVETTLAGVNSAGVRGRNNGTGTLGIGVYGSHAGGGWGVYGTSNTGVGVFGAHGAATGTAPGVYGTTASGADNAAGIEGVVTAGAPGAGAAGVLGVLAAEPPFGGWWSSGVHGQVGTTTSDLGIGVYGSHAGGGIGVFGYSGSGNLPFFNEVPKAGVTGLSEDGTGLAGVALGDGNGVYGGSENGNGLRAVSHSANGSGASGAAIRAWTDGEGGGGYAGYFEGEVVVTGNCCAAAMGTFRIDDPQDPAHQYLNHAAVASNELLDLYNGTVILDTQGSATVELPAWFTALNSSFRYQLTPIGAPGPNLYIAQEIVDNHFSIAGGTPGGKVSWQVTGVRKDPYATAHPVAVEEQKPADAQGTYLYPEGYGQPETARYNSKANSQNKP